MVIYRKIKQNIVTLIGFKNLPAYIQRFIDKVLRPYQEFTKAFINNIIIFSKTFKDHKRYLNKIF